MQTGRTPASVEALTWNFDLHTNDERRLVATCRSCGKTYKIWWTQSLAKDERLRLMRHHHSHECECYWRDA